MTSSFSKIQQQFDKLAPTYETSRLSSWYKAHGEIIVKSLGRPKNEVILDIGCGTGWLLRLVAQGREHIKGIGIDISSKMIDVAKKEASRQNMCNLTFIRADWEEFDLSTLSSKRIKTIVCANTFHYFSDPSRAAKRMFATLRKGGRFALLEREKGGSILTRVWERIHRFVIRDQVRFYVSSELIQLFESAGFSDVSIERRLRKVLWKRKLYTSLVLVSGEKA